METGKIGKNILTDLVEKATPRFRSPVKKCSFGKRIQVFSFEYQKATHLVIHVIYSN